MKIKGAIFDLDGTLLDSMFLWDTIGEDYLKSRGIVPEAGLNEKFKAMSIMDAAKYYQERYGIPESPEEIVNGVNSMIDHLYANEVKLKSGVLEFLLDMKSKDLKMCVATATDRYMVEAALRRNGVLDFFSTILTCTEVGAGKDQPIIFEQALSLLGTDKRETLVFEDAFYAIQTAKLADFKVAAVYDKSSESEQEKIKGQCDYYLTSFWEGSKVYD